MCGHYTDWQKTVSVRLACVPAKTFCAGEVALPGARLHQVGLRKTLDRLGASSGEAESFCDTHELLWSIKL
jgi:hypothetical protein